MSALLPMAVGSLVIAAAWRHRPRPSRVDALGVRSSPPARHTFSSLVERCGRRVRTACGRSPDVALDRRLGWSLVVGVAGALVDPVLAPVGLGVWVAGRWRAARRRARRDEQVVDDHPDVVDLFVLAVEAGCTPRLAVEATAAWTSGPWRTALDRVLEQVAQGVRLGDALGGLTADLGDPARPLVVALLDAEHYGTALGPSLERLARESAVERRRRAEERARRVPVQLLFPLVFCTLPAFVLLTVVPLLAGTLPTLST